MSFKPKPFQINPFGIPLQQQKPDVDPQNPIFVINISLPIPIIQFFNTLLQMVKQGLISPEKYYKTLDKIQELVEEYRMINLKEE